MNIFKELIFSIGSFESYKGFLKNRKFKVFGAGLVLITLYFVLTVLVPYARFLATTGGFGRIVTDYVPEFRLEAGQLWLEEPIQLDYGGSYVDINTDQNMMLNDFEELQGFMRDYDSVIMADGEKFLIKSEGQVQTGFFSEFGSDVTFDRQDILRYVPMANLIVVIGLIFMLIFEAAFFFFGVLMLSLIGLIIASCMKARLTFGQIFLLGIYTRTLPLLLKAVKGLASLHIPMFWVINFGISAVYLFFVFKRIKRDQEQLEAQASAGRMEYEDDGRYRDLQ